MEEAIKYLNEAISIDEDYYKAIKHRGIVYFNLSKFQNCYLDLKKALSIKIDDY